jgi:uncharacterized repeat protein (TIGR01451 family)
LGGGKIDADVNLVSATVEPGRGVAPATLNISGYLQQSGGALIVDCAANGSTDKYVVGGAAGVLDVRLVFIGGYDPANGDAFNNVITGSSYPPNSFLHYFPFGYNGTGRIVQTISPTSVSYTAIVPSADLAVSEAVGANTPPATTYPVTVTVQNLGSATASGIQVVLSAINGSIVSASSSTLTCTGSGATATCTALAIATGNPAMITVMVDVPTGNATFGASVTANELDPNAANNSVTASVPLVKPAADVSITKHAPATATPGGTITYNLDVANLGPSDAANVVVTDPTPSGLTFVSLTGGCSAFPCSLGTMSSGQTKTLTAVYSIAADLAGIVNNTAFVSSTTSDPATGNNSSHAFTTLTTTATCATPPDAPVPAVVASILSGQSYNVQWPAVDGAAQYEIDESTDASFTNTSTQTVTTTVVPFTHSTQSNETFYYRVRAFSPCAQQFSPYSQTVQVAVAPPARRRAVRR